jgi:hypothetical protein
MTKKDSLIRLSQTQLNLLETCPPRFEQIFLDQLGNPLDPQQREKGEWGSRFHQLMQQKELNLSIENILTEDSQLYNSIEALINADSVIITSLDHCFREAEHRRTLQIDNYLLTVVYDLLIAQENQAQILDWKTYLEPENSEKLANNWQTRLYLYILAETSHYLPAQLSMTYWFVKLPNQPKKLTFSYNDSLHQKTKEDLIQLLENLTQWIEDYTYKNSSFPHILDCEHKCPFSQNFSSSFNVFDSQKEILQSDWQGMLETIEEISL